MHTSFSRPFISLFLIFVSAAVFPQGDYFREDYQRNANYVYKDNIKTVLLYKEGFEMSAPMVRLHSDDKLIFSFDDLNGGYQRYDYTIVHCDADWNDSDLSPNEYLESFTDDYIEDYQYSVNTIQNYTHYRQAIPNDDIRYTLSGNYILKIYPDGYPDSLIFTRRFFVLDPKVNVVARVKPPAKVDERLTRQEIVFSIFTNNFSIDDPSREIFVTVRQNGRWDNAITNLRPYQIRGAELMYNDDGACVFDGGSDFRYFDLKSLRYNSFRVRSIEYSPGTGYQVYLHEDKVKKKYVYEHTQESMNGRYLIKTEDMNYTAFEADYATVHFFLPYPSPLIDGKLYFFGGLTYWQYLPDCEMEYDFNRGGFTGSILLKQGYYNYHYMLLPNNSKVGDVTFIEGNFFETNNQYSIFVYYKPLGGRYTRLINVTVLMAHPT